MLPGGTGHKEASEKPPNKGLLFFFFGPLALPQLGDVNRFFSILKRWFHRLFKPILYFMVVLCCFYDPTLAMSLSVWFSFCNISIESVPGLTQSCRLEVLSVMLSMVAISWWWYPSITLRLNDHILAMRQPVEQGAWCLLLPSRVNVRDFGKELASMAASSRVWTSYGFDDLEATVNRYSSQPTFKRAFARIWLDVFKGIDKGFRSASFASSWSWV